MHPKRTRPQWRELVTEFEASGLTAETFAAGRDLHPDTLRWWRHRLRREEPAALLAPRFVPIALPAVLSAVEVELRNGIRLALRFRLACDAALTSAPLAILIEEVTRRYDELARDHGYDDARCGAVTSIQRFGSALNLNPHFHTLFLDGAYVPSADGSPRRVTLQPRDEDVRDVALRVAERGDALLLASQRPEVLDEHPNLARIAQLSLLSTRLDEPIRPKPTRNGNPLPRKHMAMRVSRWDLHAATTVPQGHRNELLRLCKYIFRGALAMERMELQDDGRIAYRLRKPRFDGSTEIVLAPEDLVVRIIAMIPPPYSNQTRYHGVLAPAAKQRELIVPQARRRPCRRATKPMRCPGPDARLPWAELLRRSFSIDVPRCVRRGGGRTVIGMVTERSVARRILNHLGESWVIARLAPARGPPDDG